MKRITLLLAALLLLSACNGNQGAEETSSPPPDSPPGGPSGAPTGSPPYNAAEDTAVITDGYEDVFAYPGSDEGGALPFAVDENGVVYICVQTYQEEQIVTRINSYDMNGGLLDTYEPPIDGYIGAMCVGGGALYFTVPVEYLFTFPKEDDGLGPSFNGDVCGFDLQTRELRRLDTPSDLFTLPIRKMAHVNGSLYILGSFEDYLTDEYDHWQVIEGAREGGRYAYSYDGRILAAYDLSTGGFEIVFDELPMDFSPAPGGGKIIILARDPQIRENYFTELDLETMSVGDRIYREIRKPQSFAADGYGVLFTVSQATSDDILNSINYWPLSTGEDTGAVQLAPKGRSTYSEPLICHGGFTFYCRTGNEGRTVEIARIRNSVSITPPIKVIAAEQFDNIPREQRHIWFQNLGHDEFALSVLAGGAAYDLAYVSSQQDFAYNLRDKGSFYPLNDVPGVQAFLDKCHPYIRDAATGKNGGVWMLPISVNVEAVIYNEANCKKAGIDFSGAAAVYDIIDNVNRAADSGAPESDYFFLKADLLKKSMAKYLRGSANLDTPEFRQTAEALKAFMPGEIKYGGGGVSIPDNGNFLFMNAMGQTGASVIYRDDLYVVPLIGTGGVYSADCVFLCVSPDSGNLERTLDYISALCVYLSDKEDNFMLARAPIDSGYAKRLHALYQNAVIDFNVSDEVFTDDFNRYLNDKITLDQLIKEAGRKLAMYLGE